MDTRAFHWRHGYLTLLSAFVFTSCSSVLYVAPRQVDCTGNEEKPCYLIRNSTAGNWISHSEEISGLDYEPGFSYKIKVNSEKVKHPVLGASEQRYSLVKVLEKKEMTEDIAIEDLLDKVWSLEYLKLENTQVMVENHVPSMKFDADGKVSGNGGCNNFNSNFTLHGRAIKLGNIAATKKMCQGSMELEHAFFQALGMEVRALFSNGKLMLSSDGGNRMIFSYK